MSQSAQRAIDRIVAHWKATKRARKSVEVKEWNLTIWWDRWNLREQDACQFAFAGILLPMHYIRTLVEKATDEAGKRLFADADVEEFLTEADPAIVKRVGNLIILDLNGDHEAVRGEGDGPKD